MGTVIGLEMVVERDSGAERCDGTEQDGENTIRDDKDERDEDVETERDDGESR